MTISRVELQGQISRAQDFTTIKHQEDNKGLVDQSNQKTEVRAHQVQQGDRAENEGKRFDAKEQGNGTYQGDGGRRRKKDEKKEDGKVTLKGYGGFDIKI